MQRSAQCATFQWCAQQPLRRQWEEEHQQRGGSSSTMAAPPIPRLPSYRCQHKNISRVGTNAFKIFEKCIDCKEVLVDEPTALGKQKAQERQEKKDQKSTYNQRKGAENQEHQYQYQAGYPEQRFPVYQQDMATMSATTARRIQRSGALKPGGIWMDGPYDG